MPQNGKSGPNIEQLNTDIKQRPQNLIKSRFEQIWCLYGKQV